MLGPTPMKLNVWMSPSPPSSVQRLDNALHQILLTSFDLIHPNQLSLNNNIFGLDSHLQIDIQWMRVATVLTAFHFARTTTIVPFIDSYNGNFIWMPTSLQGSSEYKGPPQCPAHPFSVSLPPFILRSCCSCLNANHAELANVIL